ncbi:hypothetical protein IJI31_05745 [bacterium]|nr:hypothetical protein [bacterium]
MKINPVNNINFKKNYFCVQKRGELYRLNQIATDNEENLGKEPVLIGHVEGEDYERPMSYNGKYYSAEAFSGTTNYKIYYKDTGKYENGGKSRVINPLNYMKIATKADKLSDGQNLEYAFAKGRTSGKVVVNTLDIPKDTPVVLVLDEITDDGYHVFKKLGNNVKAVITSSCHFGALTHAASAYRNKVHVMSEILDDDKFDELKNCEGKNITVNNLSGVLNYKLTDEVETETPQNVSKVIVPHLEYTDRILDFDELTPENCGNKGYRLGILKKLSENGVLKDVTVPKGFVLPEGYLKKAEEYFDVEDEEEKLDRIFDGIYTEEIRDKVESLGVDISKTIIRSNFNTEDLSEFSSAGIYDSFRNYNEIEPFLHIKDVVESKKSELAKYVHNRYGIKDSEIQPSVIVQDYIRPDYNFTVYSDDKDNNVLIELTDYRLGFLETTPAQIKYNKDTKEITLTKKQKPMADFWLDENGKILEKNYDEVRMDRDWESLVPVLKKVASNSEILEKFFNAPQDIEGGIKNGKIYFWQTRDIVAKPD